VPMQVMSLIICPKKKKLKCTKSSIELRDSLLNIFLSNAIRKIVGLTTQERSMGLNSVELETYFRRIKEVRLCKCTSIVDSMLTSSFPEYAICNWALLLAWSFSSRMEN
jgi:hypothetical protein